MIAKDTQKEEREKILADSWETKEPGRKDRAKESRKLYFLRKKKLNGETLTEEELRILNEPKAERYTLEDGTGKPGQQGKKDQQGKGTKPNVSQPPAKKPNQPGGKKDGKDGGKDEEPKKEIVFPKSSEHDMKEIKEFLRHMERERVSFEGIEEGQKPRVRHPREFEEINQTCLMNIEDAGGSLEKLAKSKEDLKTLRDKVIEYNRVGLPRAGQPIRRQCGAGKAKVRRIQEYHCQSQFGE